MPNQIIQISIELLEKMYFYGFDSYFHGNLKELLPSYSVKKIKNEDVKKSVFSALELINAKELMQKDNMAGGF